MARIARITADRTGRRRRIVLDDGRRLDCPANIARRRGLAVGDDLDPRRWESLEGEVRRQACLDAGLRLLARKAHATARLAAKLTRRFDPQDVAAVIDELRRLGYLNDSRLAMEEAQRLCELGMERERALARLLRHGLDEPKAREAVGSAYRNSDPVEEAKEVARRLTRTARGTPAAQRRKLLGALSRRGFDDEVVRRAVEEVLGPDVD